MDKIVHIPNGFKDALIQLEVWDEFVETLKRDLTFYDEAVKPLIIQQINENYARTSDYSTMLKASFVFSKSEKGFDYWDKLAIELWEEQYDDSLTFSI